VIAVVAIAPRFLPVQTFFVRSGSMRPTIAVGAQAFYTPVDSRDLQRGDIIIFRRPGGTGELVTHRIFAVEHTGSGTQFVTKGDANALPDPWRVPATGHGWRYVVA